MNRTVLIAVAGGLVAIVAVLAAIVFKPAGPNGAPANQVQLATGTNPTLDIRFKYDPAVLSPAPHDSRAEYPLQLDGQGWGLYGKRIRGLGAMLETIPGPLLYDYVASQHADTYEDWYKFEMLEEEYEDTTIGGRPAVHCTWVFGRTADSRDWPGYFPDAVKAGEQVHMQGWSVFSNNDLFFFYTFSSEPIGDADLGAVVDLLNSLEYGALFGSDEPQPGRGEPR